MFREMRRKKQQLSNSECFEILDNSNTAVLALIGDGGYPYTVPLNFVRLDNKVYFHCAKTGHKSTPLKIAIRRRFVLCGGMMCLPKNIPLSMKA